MKRSGLVLLLAALLLLVLSQDAGATVDFAQQTGKPCTFCHRGPGGPLNEQGEDFREAGYRLPGTDSDGGSGGAGEAPSDAPRPGSLIELSSWGRALLLWLHLVSMTAWLGAIIFVHVVQTPRVAGRGIPRGYFVLAWPSIVVLGTSGVLLTLAAVRGLSELGESRWGLLLLVKMGLYLLLVLVAIFVTFFLGPRLRRMAQSGPTHPLAEHVAYAQEGRITIGYEGRIYDVTASSMWREGRHMKRHEAWQDLTADLAGAPHGPEVLKKFRVVAGGPAWTPAPLRFFLLLAYGNLGLVLAVLLVVALWLAS